VEKAKKNCVQPHTHTALTHGETMVQHLRFTHGDVKAKLNQYKLVMPAAGLCVLVVQNRWYQEGKIREWHRNLDNMKMRVKICTIQNAGQLLRTPEFETRPVDFVKRPVEEENSISKA
jgi:hypothetical protein